VIGTMWSLLDGRQAELAERVRRHVSREGMAAAVNDGSSPSGTGGRSIRRSGHVTP
jgi:hypothetical protein